MFEDHSWRRFIEGERRELEARREGQLARLLMVVLPDESPEELNRLIEEEQRRAQEGLVELVRGGERYHKHIDELTAEDVPARLEAKSARLAWLTAHTRRVFEETQRQYNRK
jgi:hypothetical protein